MQVVRKKHSTQNGKRAVRKRPNLTSTKRAVVENPYVHLRNLAGSSLYEFIQLFWPVISNDEFKTNWHIKYICDELEKVAHRVAQNKPKLYDLIINVPPGSTKTSIISIMFPVWCWVNWYWMRFITAGYSATLSLEAAESSRDLVRSERFKKAFPELVIKEDKDTKSNFKLQKKERRYKGRRPRLLEGGNRYSTSVKGTLTGFHGHILILDDPLNPHQALSEQELYNTNRWIDNTLSTRKTDKEVTPTIVVMQRLHQNDPTGHILENRSPDKIKHISLPGEIFNYEEEVKPRELKEKYVNGLLDPRRLNEEVLRDLQNELGQYGYAGQIGQRPTPPGGGMFQVDGFSIIEQMPARVNVTSITRYWDKAGTDKKDNPNAAYTCGVKMAKLKSGKQIIMDVVRGQWSSDKRERIIRQTAEADGQDVYVYIEQEPGSGGKESAEHTVRNLSGFSIHPDRPSGDKVFRADPYSVQVNSGNVWLLRGEWNQKFIDEHRNFPYSITKDQVDAASGAFAKLSSKKQVKVL